MRIAVVAEHFDASEWSEEALVTRRLAGALACNADVDVLLADGTPGVAQDGALRVLRFAAARSTPERRAAYVRAAFGFDDFRRPSLCGCAAPLARAIARELPVALQARIADLAAPESAELREHLARERYDVVVAAGYAAGTRLADLGGSARRVLAPLARDEPSFHLPIFDRAFAAAETLIVFTEVERELVRSRSGSARVENVGFTLRVDSGDSLGHDGRRRFVIARDWTAGFAYGWLASLARAVVSRFADAELHLVGPGATAIPAMTGVVASTVRSRRDVERRMQSATAVIDPEPHRLLGRDVIEAMLLARPVVVPAWGGATREHADAGDAGLWYRSDEELERCLAIVGDGDVGATLGRQGSEHAERLYGNPDEFIRRVTDVVAG